MEWEGGGEGGEGGECTNLMHLQRRLAVGEESLHSLLLPPWGGHRPLEQLLPHPAVQTRLEPLHGSHLPLEHLHHLHNRELPRHNLQDLLHHPQVI